MLALVFAAALATSAPTEPDPQLTPGAWREISLIEICTTKWGKDHRAVTAAMKAQVFERYGFSGDEDPRCIPPGTPAAKLKSVQRCEVDHRRPRELGGADQIENLWIEAYFGGWNAHDKDRLENYAHDRVCDTAHPMPLEEARAMFEGDWHAAYIQAFGGPPPSVETTK